MTVRRMLVCSICGSEYLAENQHNDEACLEVVVNQRDKALEDSRENRVAFNGAFCCLIVTTGFLIYYIVRSFT